MASPRGITLRRCGCLTASTVGLWVLLAWPAYRWSGFAGVEELSFAAGLCLIPGWLAFWLVSRYVAAKSQSLAMLAGSVLRMFFVLAGVLLLRMQRDEIPKSFLVWLVVFYLMTLAVETRLVLKNTASPTP